MENSIHKLFDKIQIKNLPRSIKRIILLFADFVLIPLALWSAFALRLGEPMPYIQGFWWMFLVAPLVSIPIFIKLGLYHAVVRFMGTHAMYAILKGVTLSTLLLATIVLLSGVKGVPRSVFLIYWGVAVLYIGGSRFLMRSYFYALTRPKNSRNIYAIYGAGESGIQLYHALRHGHDAIPVAFIDDDKTLHGSLIRGLKVYPPSILASLVEEYGISQILLAMPSVSRARRRAIVEELERLPVHVRTIPSMTDLVSGYAKVNELREVEIEDLLGRDTVAPNKELLEKCIKNKNVMITGAGGSIGSELCRKIALLEPNNLIMLDISEYALYRINNEIQTLAKNTKTNIIPLLGNIQEQSYFEKIIEIYNVQTIYHAAAYKHVPLVEHNILEAIKNNIIGTLHTAFAAKKCKVETFVLISSDKAVRPTNVMGATKRFAELILQGLANDIEANQKNINNTHFCMVRFGNVLGSSGSVVPLFIEQIRAGGPVTLTHPDIIRYFMTIPEAAQLVIQAGAMGDKGEVFVLDMGEPIKIYDLAKRMVNLSGLTLKDDFHQDGDVEIKTTGLRPGEKLYEELLIGENATETQHPRIMQAQERYIAYDELKDDITELEKYIKENDIKSILYLLLQIIDGYVPEEEIKDYLWNQSENDKSNQVEGAKTQNIVRLDAIKIGKE
jgi:FlaA1/EpsC-like NDP-sugar epimerase